MRTREGAVQPVVDPLDDVAGAYPAEHDGWHAEAGVDGLRWGEGDNSGTRG